MSESSEHQEVPRLPYSSRLGCLMIPTLIIGVIAIVGLSKAAGLSPFVAAILSGVWVLIGALWMPRWRLLRRRNDTNR
jgi:hypothetical protein